MPTKRIVNASPLILPTKIGRIDPSGSPVEAAPSADHRHVCRSHSTPSGDGAPTTNDRTRHNPWVHPLPPVVVRGLPTCPARTVGVYERNSGRWVSANGSRWVSANGSRARTVGVCERKSISALGLTNEYVYAEGLQ